MGKNRIPSRIFFTKGVGRHKDRLVALDRALQDAGIASEKLVRVASTFPPHCKVIPRKEGMKFIRPRKAVFAVVVENSTCEVGHLIASAIGAAIPTDQSTSGYLAQRHSYDETEAQARDHVEEFAAEMLATSLDVDFDSAQSWDEREAVYRIDGKTIRTESVFESAKGDKKGRWTTTIAAAILIFDNK